MFFYKENYNQNTYDLYQYHVQSNYNFQKQSITLVIVRFYNFALSYIEYIHPYISTYVTVNFFVCRLFSIINNVRSKIRT